LPVSRLWRAVGVGALQLEFNWRGTAVERAE